MAATPLTGLGDRRGDYVAGDFTPDWLAGFGVMSVNAPFMVDTVPGLPSAIFEPYVQWTKGNITIPCFAQTIATPQGRGNYIRYTPDPAETILLG